MRPKRVSIIVGVIGLIAMIGIACTADVSEATRVPTPQFDPTPAGEAAPEPTQPPAVDSTEAPAAATEEPAVSVPSGDASNGESLFTSNGCSNCHSTGDNTVVGPGLKGVGARAGDRIAGLDVDEYITASIRDPKSFIVDGMPDAMPDIFGSLSDSDVLDLVAYLKSLN